MPVTQREIALQMLAQLRVLDPSVSAAIGTPERKIIDTVAQALADSEIDLTLLSGALDIDAKSGSNLENFLALFGFARQKATGSSGFVTLSRNLASTQDIRIPSNTQLMAADPHPEDALVQSVFFLTAGDAVIPAGQLSVTVPVFSTTTGSTANVPTNTILAFAGTPPFGVTAVTNPLDTTGGNDAESDDEFKVRFKNTVFRNLSGTEDQFLALAVSTQFTTKATAVGPISRYREYIQVPARDDKDFRYDQPGLEGQPFLSPYDVNGDGIPDPTNTTVGAANQWTTALSTIPYSKHTYANLANFVSTSATGVSAVFYREDVDYSFNVTDIAKNRGDAYRFASVGEGVSPASAEAFYKPNLTFLNIYNGSDDTVQAPRPGDVVLFEHVYMSSASRNDWTRNITNAVDVYIENTGLSTLASATVPTPGPSPSNVFATSGKFDIQFYRRKGQSNRPPIVGNIFIPLYWQPLDSVPDTLTISGTLNSGAATLATYNLDDAYFLVEDVSQLYGTVRARDGIEWNVTSKGFVAGVSDNGPTILDFSNINSIRIDNYGFDKNIVDLQVALEGNKQITTDVLAHRARTRYFKLDVTAMYSVGQPDAGTNQDVHDSLQEFFDGLDFGSFVQLSDLIQVIHGVAGIDNVRWSSDIPTTPDLVRITECDSTGSPLLNVLVDRIQAGDTTGITDRQRIIVSGGPTGGTYRLATSQQTTGNIAYNANAATVAAAMTAAGFPTATVSGAGTLTNPFIVAFTDLFNGNGTRDLIVSDSALTGGPTIFDTDFALKDDELGSLPLEAIFGDTLPGLIIRTRAQNTWLRS